MANVMDKIWIFQWMHDYTGHITLQCQPTSIGRMKEMNRWKVEKMANTFAHIFTVVRYLFWSMLAHHLCHKAHISSDASQNKPTTSTVAAAAKPNSQSIFMLIRNRRSFSFLTGASFVRTIWDIYIHLASSWSSLSPSSDEKPSADKFSRYGKHAWSYVYVYVCVCLCMNGWPSLLLPLRLRLPLLWLCAYGNDAVCSTCQ